MLRKIKTSTKGVQMKGGHRLSWLLPAVPRAVVRLARIANVNDRGTMNITTGNFGKIYFNTFSGSADAPNQSPQRPGHTAAQLGTGGLVNLSQVCAHNQGL